METHIMHMVYVSRYKVFTLPMRNGNLRSSIVWSFLWCVFTLPMRNGNVSNMSRWVCAAACFYLTYEEWKRGKDGFDLFATNVFTLPMRNGNRLFFYLSLLLIFVFTLPMRNGNLFFHSLSPLALESFYLTYEEWKLGTCVIIRVIGN